METFKDLEEKHPRTAVSVKGPKAATGILSLSGADSFVELVSEGMFHVPTDRNGWFDLTLQTSNGTPILLHHALTTGSTHFGFGTRHESRLYPNTVVIGPAAASEGIREITFTLRGLKHFFHYPHIEWQSGYRTKADLKGVAGQMRAESAALVGMAARDEVLRPREIYIAHDFPRAMKFRIEDRFYSVTFITRSRGMGGSGINVNVEPIATIGFAEPVTIEVALNRLWEWRHFFLQVAMEPMPVTAISVRDAISHRSPSADVYLPGVKDEQTGRANLHPGDIPLNQWEERCRLRDVMQRWLSKAEERKTFRAYLGNVIEARLKRFETQDVVRLCSGIESLSELSEASDLEKSDIMRMGEAAHASMADSSVQPDKQRIMDVLAILRQMSLSKRLDLLAQATAPAVSEQDAEALFRAAKDLRNSAAHGRSISDERTPIAAPVTDGLAGICAAYDLLTCGMPDMANEHSRLNALTSVNRSALELRTLANS